MHQIEKILVGGRDNTNIDFALPRVADTLYFPFLQNPQ